VAELGLIVGIATLELVELDFAGRLVVDYVAIVVVRDVRLDELVIRNCDLKTGVNSKGDVSGVARGLVSKEYG
jgi:hypothetical protein